MRMWSSFPLIWRSAEVLKISRAGSGLRRLLGGSAARSSGRGPTRRCRWPCGSRHDPLGLASRRTAPGCAVGVGTWAGIDLGGGLGPSRLGEASANASASSGVGLASVDECAGGLLGGLDQVAGLAHLASAVARAGFATSGRGRRRDGLVGVEGVEAVVARRYRKKFSWRQRLNMAWARRPTSGSARVVRTWVWWPLVGIQTGDLAAGEASAFGVVGDADPSIGEQVVVVRRARRQRREGRRRCGVLGRRAFPVGQESEPGLVQRAKTWGTSPLGRSRWSGERRGRAARGPCSSATLSSPARRRRAGPGRPAARRRSDPTPRCRPRRAWRGACGPGGPWGSRPCRDRRDVPVHVVSSESCPRRQRRGGGPGRRAARRPCTGRRGRPCAGARSSARVPGRGPAAGRGRRGRARVAALGPGFAHQRSEHDGEHETAQPVEGGPGPTVGRLDAVEQARDRQSRQHDQRPGQRQRRPRGDAGLGLGQLAAPSRLALGLPGFGAGQRLEPTRSAAGAGCAGADPASARGTVARTHPEPRSTISARERASARSPRLFRPPSPRSAWRAHGGRAARGRAPPPRRRGTPGASATGSRHRCRRRQPPRRRGPRPPRSAAPPPAAGPPHLPAANTTSPSPTRTPRRPRPTRPGPPHSTRARTRKGRPAPASDNPCAPPLRLPPPPPPCLKLLRQLWTARERQVVDDLVLQGFQLTVSGVLDSQVVATGGRGRHGRRWGSRRRVQNTWSTKAPPAGTRCARAVERSPGRARDNAQMAGRPSGTVTFLFTDIEGSTRQWERDPDGCGRRCRS